MKSIWRSLLWREWHEHKWKLASLVAIMLSMQAMALWGDPKMVALTGQLAAFCAIVPLAVFIAMRTAAGERADGTLAFVRGLPVRSWKLAAVKLAAGAVTLFVPILLAMLPPLVWLVVLRLARDSSHESPFPLRGVGPYQALAYSGLLAAGMATSCFAWTVAFGVRKATEIRAGLTGAALLVAALAFRSLDERWAQWPDPSAAMRLVRGINEIGPLGFTLLFDPRVSAWEVALVQLGAIALLAGWSLIRYGKESKSENASLAALLKRSDKSPSQSGAKLRPAWRGELTAIAWKQWREALPFFLVALVLIACIAVWARLLDGGNDPMTAHLSEAGVTVGFVAALLIGIGTFVGELQSRVLDFWRSRPIDPAFWFWTKYATGLLTAITIMAVPTAFDRDPDIAAILLSLPWLAIVYSIAVCLTCWVRQATYAGILSFALAMFLWVASAARWIPDFLSYPIIYQRARNLNFGDWATHIYLPFLAFTLAVAAAFAAAGWLAVKRDLGLHRIPSGGSAAHALN